jgi:hypothetical protein
LGVTGKFYLNGWIYGVINVLYMMCNGCVKTVYIYGCIDREYMEYNRQLFKPVTQAAVAAEK